MISTDITAQAAKYNVLREQSHTTVKSANYLVPTSFHVQPERDSSERGTSEQVERSTKKSTRFLYNFTKALKNESHLMQMRDSVQQHTPKPVSFRSVRDVFFAEGWLGRQDSNLGMSIPKTDALPLGDAPTSRRIYINPLQYATHNLKIVSGFFSRCRAGRLSS